MKIFYLLGSLGIFKLLNRTARLWVDLILSGDYFKDIAGKFSHFLFLVGIFKIEVFCSHNKILPIFLKSPPLTYLSLNSIFFNILLHLIFHEHPQITFAESCLKIKGSVHKICLMFNWGERSRISSTKIICLLS